MKQTVKLTLEKVQPAGNKVTCNIDTADPLNCDAASNSDLKTITPSTTGVSVTAILADAVDSTTTFRCSVEVGTDEDGKATDTKLIYVQKIDVKYWSYDLDVHQMIAPGDKLKVSVYDDNAYGVKTADSKCKIGGGAEATLGDDVVVADEETAGGKTLSCNLKFDTAKNKLTKASATFRYVSPAIKIVTKCTVGKFWDTTVKPAAACADCPDNSYRTATMSQFESCRPCPTGQTHKSEKDGCKECGAGEILTTDGCQKCPAGTKKDGLSCAPCPAGKYQPATGMITCDPCSAGYFSAASASSTCTQCPEGTVVSTTGATGCKTCSAGQKSNNDRTACVDCPAGDYSAVPGSSTCTKCPDGTYSGPMKASKCLICEAGKKPKGDKTGCEDCDAGYYSTGDGSSTCYQCPPGTYSAAGATECTACEKGKYSNQAGASSCQDCDQDSFQYTAAAGSTSCLTCQGTRSSTGDQCEECKAGQKYEGGKCVPCGDGEVSEAGSGSCKLCPQGTRKVENECIKCQPGEKQALAGQETCELCDAARGEYQTEEGSSYCKTTSPGYQLDGGNTKKEQIKCKKNYFSTGGAKKCTMCDQDRGEYTVSEGSTYCSICLGKIKDGSCGATTCEKNTITLTGIGPGNFTFEVTDVGTTASVKCAEDAEELITRYCSYNSLARTGEWLHADSTKCKSAFTDAVKNKTQELATVDVKDETKTTEAVDNMKTLAEDAKDMAPQDLSNIATSLGSFTKKLTEENVEVTEAQAVGVADTVSSVATAGPEKLSSVTNDEKTQMRNSVTSVSQQLKDTAPVQTDTIAMRRIPLEEVDEKDAPIDLPKPQKDTLSAPKLKMKKASTADGTKVAPTVAVFDKETAKAIFPTPSAESSASSDDAASSDTGTATETTTSTLAITYSIDSSIVSLEFAGADDIDIEIDIPVDITDDAEKEKNSTLERVCKFYDETAEIWSTKGCTTVEGKASGKTEKSYKCQCSHNTSFAIILSEAEIADNVQSTVSTVLNIINIIFLALTFLCIAPFKQFRSRRLIQIQVQLCAALLIGHIAFIILGTTTASNPACTPGVIIVQYLFLVAVAWSVCASVTLYEKIVNALKSFGKQDKHYMLKCMGGCWIAPLFMVLSAYVTSFAMKDIPYVTSTGELDDEKTEVCWVASPWKWLGFCIPVYLCLGVNVVLFIMIARIIIRAGKSGSSTGHAREVKAIMSIAITVCLPWLIALLMTGPKEMAQVFQWIFLIVTALQGPTMFVCYVIFQEDVLTNLFKLFGQEPPQALLPAKSSKSTKSAASESSAIKPTSAAVKKEERSDIVQVKNPEYNNPVQEQRQSEENIYSKVDEEAPPAQQDDTISRGSRSSKHMYESTSFTQHGDKEESINPVPAVEQGETYENSTANDLDIAQNSYPHVPQLV